MPILLSLSLKLTSTSRQSLDHFTNVPKDQKSKILGKLRHSIISAFSRYRGLVHHAIGKNKPFGFHDFVMLSHRFEQVAGIARAHSLICFILIPARTNLPKDHQAEVSTQKSRRLPKVIPNPLEKLHKKPANPDHE